jgi:hypothetical protein
MYNCWVDHYGYRPGMARSDFMNIPTDVSYTIGTQTVHGWSVAARVAAETATPGSHFWSEWPYTVWKADENDSKGDGYGSEISRDGELLVENSVYTGYTAGEDHAMNDDLVAQGFITSGQRWKVYSTAANSINAVINHGQNWPDPLAIVRGCLLEGSARYGDNLTVISGTAYAPSPNISPFNGTHPLFRGWRNGHYNSTSNDYVNNTSWTWAQDSGVNGDGGAGPDWGGVPPYTYPLYTADATLKADLTRGSGNAQAWQLVS